MDARYKSKGSAPCGVLARLFCSFFYEKQDHNLLNQHKTEHSLLLLANFYSRLKIPFILFDVRHQKSLSKKLDALLNTKNERGGTQFFREGGGGQVERDSAKLVVDLRRGIYGASMENMRVNGQRTAVFCFVFSPRLLRSADIPSGHTCPAPPLCTVLNSIRE